MSEQKMTGKEWLDRWVAALMSGKYEQGGTYLYDRHGNNYCGIGVGLRSCGFADEDIAGRTIPIDSAWPVDGLDVRHPVTGHVKCFTSILIDMNDERRWTFEQIAIWLDSSEIRTAIENHIDGGCK